MAKHPLVAHALHDASIHTEQQIKDQLLQMIPSNSKRRDKGFGPYRSFLDPALTNSMAINILCDCGLRNMPALQIAPILACDGDPLFLMCIIAALTADRKNAG